ncbi:hypothetical protein CGH64_23170, partial [Vibrio parahaemolyticus]
YGNLTDLERASLESGGELSKSVLSLLVSDILFSVLPYDESFWVTNAKTTTDNEFYQLRDIVRVLYKSEKTLVYNREKNKNEYRVDFKDFMLN